MMKSVFLGLLFFLLSHSLVSAWIIHRTTPTSLRRSVCCWAGGFGGGGNNGGPTKLKPKQQWDRYLALKDGSSCNVGVRCEGSDEWLRVGSVKAQTSVVDVATAVVRQRALIADHARRLFPLQVNPKVKVEWGYQENDSTTWQVVDPKQDVPKGVEKSIGFEGTPDPDTGFYCVYNEGRLVVNDETSRPSSKKLQ